MRTERRHTPWWQLYLLVLGMIGLLVLGALTPMPERAHQVVAIGTLLLTWALVELWLRANAAALLVSNVILVPPPQPTAERRPRDDERQPAPASRRQAQEADGRPVTESGLALGNRGRTTC
jgi:hypothetical protein